MPETLATYDYQTGQTTRNFKFVQYGTKCRLSGLQAIAGLGESQRCRKCKYNGGTFNTSNVGVEYWNRFHETYVMCKHPQQADTENDEIGSVRSVFYENLRTKALCAL